MDFSVIGCLVITCLTYTQGYNTGAPRQTCVSMTPGHQGEPPETPSPFKIEVSPATYRPNSIVVVTLTTCGPNVEGFKGFILQARLAKGGSTIPIGVFTIPPMTQSVKGCGTALHQSVTHSSNHTKNQLTIEWSHPVSKGHVVMVATFVASYSTFWREVYSEVIFDENKPVVPEDYRMYPSVNSCPQPEETVTRPVEPPLGEIFDDQLGSLISSPPPDPLGKEGEFRSAAGVSRCLPLLLIAALFLLLL